jgi:hypothetical protein
LLVFPNLIYLLNIFDEEVVLFFYPDLPRVIIVYLVFQREKIMLSIGDRVRFTKNVKRRGQQFLNNELRTVVGIDDSKIIFDKGELVRNGVALHVDQGIAVTSHASQAKTVDQVIVNVPVRAFSQANEAQFYVDVPRSFGDACLY